MPLAEVPLNRPEVAGVKHVAGHELNHALVAYRLGVPVSGISVIPEGNTLGRTMLANASLGDMQIVAAAGSVHAHDGRAMGYGSDMQKVVMIGRHFGGISADQARSIAASILGEYSVEVREKAAEILAYMGQVSGTTLPDIIARAKFEVRLEKAQAFPHLTIDPTLELESLEIPQFVDLSSLILIDNDSVISDQEIAVIEKYANGDSKVQWIKGEKVVRETAICGSCGSLDGHTIGCPILKMQLGEKQKSQSGFSPTPKSKDKSVTELFPVEPPLIDPAGSVFDRKKTILDFTATTFKI